ncbi:MAG TPA: hypothetical protein VF472_17110 [Burkholderiaceae bacterium]
MKNFSYTLLLPVLIASAAARADDQASEQKKPKLTQSQLALDHGPHAQVTPAVKRKRLEAAKADAASSAPAQSK